MSEPQFNKDRKVIRLLLRPRLYLIVALGLVFLYAAFWIYRLVVTTLGPFAPLAAILGAGLVVAIAGPWLIVHYREPFFKAIFKGVDWLILKIRATGLPGRLLARYPRLTRFVEARLALNAATGLGLTISLIVVGIIVWSFIELLIEVVCGKSIVGDDTRIINLVATLRTSTLDNLMFSLSFLGNGRVITVLAVLVGLIALLWRRYEWVVLLAVSLVASSLLFTLIKVVVGRPRPPLEEARYLQTGFSFPSGHSSVSATFYLTLAYLAFLLFKKEWLKILPGFIACLIVLGIGVSRVYLGVHYPSDVLGGWLAGLFWFALIAGTQRIWSRFIPFQTQAIATATRTDKKADNRQKAKVAISVILTLASAIYLISVYPSLTAVSLPTLSQPVLEVSSDVAQTVKTTLPHYSESLFGSTEEPINIVLVGSETNLEAAFQAAKWTKAQKQGTGSLGGAVLASVSGHPDPAGPVTPAFWNDEPNTLAFSQPVGQNFSKRHHIKIWATRLQTSQGQPIWMATASYDEGFELAKGFLPTHQIAPDIDNERDYIVTSLQGAGKVDKEENIPLVPPQLGYNFAGDPFFTYGMAAFIWLK